MRSYFSFSLNNIKYSSHVKSVHRGNSGRKLALDSREGRLPELLHWERVGPELLS